MSEKGKKSHLFLVRPIVIVGGIICSVWLVLWVEKVHPSDLGFYKDIFQREEVIQKRKDYPLRKTHVPLTEEEIEIGRIAWKYFENNYNPENGLVNSVDQYNATTFWDVGSSLMATVSAYEIGIIQESELHKRLIRTLETMKTLNLYNNKLPNKVYNTIDLEMTTYDNQPTRNGIGWSSMDLGRFLGFCTRIMHNYPEYTRDINSILARWDLQEAIEDASLIGIGLSFKDGVEKRVQEGKLGYEEYCAKGFSHMGYDVSNALSYTDFYKAVEINGIDVGVDTREVKHHPSYNYVLSDPYVLDGLEYGFDVNSLELAYRIFQAQKKQSKKTGELISVGESHIDQEPYFIYNTLYTNGKTWNCVSESGEDANHLKTFSTSVAFGWAYLFDDPYSQKLLKKAKDLYHPDLGFYAGYYMNNGTINKAITANVNSAILGALNYRLHGPIIFRRIENK